MLRRNVLIFHQAALGDFIVTWPIAMALSRILPQSRIIYVTHSQKGALAERVLRVERADAEAGWHLLHLPPPQVPQLPDRSQQLLDAAHTVVSFTAGQTDALAQGLARVAPHAKLVCLDTRRNVPAVHVSESLVCQLHDWPALAGAAQQMLRSIATRGIAFNRTPQSGRAVIHPGAGKESNRWPAQRFLELIRALQAAGRSVRVLLGEAEIDRWPGELVAQFESQAEVRRARTLLDLLEEIAAAAVFVGNDSGPGHLAGILGVPTVSLFGPNSDPVRWRPLGPAVSLLCAAAMEEIRVDQVLAAANLAAGVSE
ncbi:glycosyltransferase family 9 protein [Fontivita pretiosa]|uniref:glycosyltransferase family 9 protein n=1 Tax=Fontivita pretiosa TaxID=2989684 RepID=UPI003D16EF1D